MRPHVLKHSASRRAALAASMLLVCAFVARADAPLTFQKPRYTRDQMEALLASGAERWLLVYGTVDPGSAAALRERAMAAARRLAGGDSTVVVADRDARSDDVARRSVVLFGGPAANAWTAKLAAMLPVQFRASGFRWKDRDYTRPSDVIQLVYPNPLDPRHLLLLVAANSPQAMSGRGGMMLGDEDWRIYRDGDLVRSGRFAQTAAMPWRYDPTLDRDRQREREQFAATLERTRGRGVVVAAARGVASQRALRVAEGLERKLEGIGFTRVAPISLILYSSLEQKATLTRNSRPEHVGDDGVAHVALPAGHDMEDLWSVVAAGLEHAGGSLDSRFMVPAAVWLAGRYGGESLSRAVMRVYFGRLLPSAAEAATSDSLWRSPLIWIPARALLAASVYQTAGRNGRAALSRLLARDPPADLAGLCRVAGVSAERVGRRYLDLADSLARQGQRERPTHLPHPWRPSEGFQRGVCFAHAVSLERGYLSSGAVRELAALQSMGANWISITPFGYLPAPDVPVIYPSAQGGPDEENDESMCEAAARAHALGLRVWLKPHLWTRGWVGELQFGAGGWDRFFAQYRRFLLHEALLAQREGMDGLVVGHELPTATLRFPERWRALIGEVRRVYTGTLTYGANWQREVEGVTFWDALDLIGVSFYDPLADKPTRDPAKLESGAERALAPLRELSVRFGKPVVLLEAGYPSTSLAAVRPWDEDRGTPDLEAQRSCYDALVRALEPADWVAGAFFWKWFSTDRGGGPQDASFTPRGKPAQEVMARAFRDWQGRPVRIPAK